MGRVSPEQIERAKQVDILDYLQRHEPENLVRQRRDRFTLRDHDSFVISNGKWCWFSRGIGCNSATALNYLIKVRGYDFVSAVQTLSGDAPAHYRINPSKGTAPLDKKQFILPPRNQDNRRVIAYLQSRGIDKALVEDCILHGRLYESATHHNCVFLGKNEDGKIRFGCMRSTTGRFRRDLDGSDKRFGFLLPPEKPENACNIAVFEAPIDALSHQTMTRQGFMEWDGWRLALSGGSLMALTHFLGHHSEVNQVYVCTDRDEAGRIIAGKIEAIPADKLFSHVAVTQSPPSYGNDYNDTLTALQKTRREQSRPAISNRKDDYSL
jgi:hypothetical protein